MLRILAIGVGGEERVAILTMKGLISRLSGSILNKMLTFATRALIHGALFGQIPRLHNNDFQNTVQKLRSRFLAVQSQATIRSITTVNRHQTGSMER